MKRNQRYFYRHRGQWHWQARFQLKSAWGLWTSALSLPHKMRLAAMCMGQALVGQYDLHTLVDPLPDGSEVRHLTVFSKWGICFLYSEKRFALDADGMHLTLTGQEYYWPGFANASPFGPLPGQIEASGVEAVYQMPLLNLPCKFYTRLNGEEGWIRLDAGWLTGEIQLTSASMGQLRARLHQEQTDRFQVDALPED